MATLTSISWKGRVLQSATTGVTPDTTYSPTFVEIQVPLGHAGTGKIHCALSKTGGGVIDIADDFLQIFGSLALGGSEVGFRDALTDEDPVNLLTPFDGETTAVLCVPVELYPWMGFKLIGDGTAVWTFTEDLTVVYT